MSEDEFDVEKLRLRPEDIAAYVGKAGAAAPRARRQDQFTIVPMTWVNQLKGVRARHVSAFKLALHLLHQHWKNGGQRHRRGLPVCTGPDRRKGFQKKSGRKENEISALNLPSRFPRMATK
jgi:hypothetical protein